MTTSDVAVGISGREWTYLRNTTFLPANLQEIVRHADVNGNKYVVRVSREVAEQFRSAFSERLTSRGIDLNYEPTNEGRLLEDLIDRFYAA